MKSKEALRNVANYLSGEIVVLPNGKKIQTTKKSVKGTQLTKGMLVSASYNSTNQGLEFYEVLGVSDLDVKYGDGGVKFNSVKDAAKKYGLKTLKEMENYPELKHMEYGHGFYLWVRDVSDNSKGGWFYLFEGRWSRGSGAEKLSFYEFKYV
jgi:hypothetical protein